jgi:hypothetical protein
MSIDNLSSTLYRKNTGRHALKKSGVTPSAVVKKFFMSKGEPYTQAKLEQQIKAYELT